MCVCVELAYYFYVLFILVRGRPPTPKSTRSF